jgi:predicted metal-dependent phosphoesterase TrpH
MLGNFDLHIHTTASDGSDTPRALAGKIAGLRLFSVTDHDTIEGTLEMAALVPDGVKYLMGVEFSCISPAGKCHILGYGFDTHCPQFRSALEEGRQLRLDKLRRRLDRLKTEFGIQLTEAELLGLQNQNSPGKPHLGRILVDRGLAEDLDEAIGHYLKKDPPGRDRIEAKTAVDAILAAGGFPVWAHPLGGEGEKRLTIEKFEALLAHLLDCGIRGLECRYSRYGREEREFLLARASSAGLVPTGGSDYHGIHKPDLKIGCLGTDDGEFSVDTDQLFGIILQKGHRSDDRPSR